MRNAKFARDAQFANANFGERKICQCNFCVTQTFCVMHKFCEMPNLLNQILGMGHLWAILGLSWGHLGPMLEPPWAILGLSWGHLGSSWGYFTSTLLPADLSQDFCACVLSMRNVCFWNPPTVAISRATVGESLGPSGSILAHLAGTLEPSWAILGPSWAHLGPILGCPGATVAELTQNLLTQIVA